MISSNSRYASSTVLTATTGTSSRQVIVPGVQQAFTFTYTSHVLSSDERIDSLAQIYYGDATKWWQIADANPSVIEWDNVPAGTVLRIPNG